MAAIESSSGGINRDELDDITTCCICTEVYTDPKALPCIHTFCMKCIQETGVKSNKGPGDEMPCPICRRLFKIPTEGYSGLPKNFFIERLILLSKVSDPSDVGLAKELCSLCLEESEEQQGKETPTADTYCVDCKYKLCEECCSEHRKFKATKNHKLIPINEHTVYQNPTIELIQSVCEMHEQQVLNLYCDDCKTVVCAFCFIEEHNNHKGSHVNKCLDGFRKQIENTTKGINECIAKAHMKKSEIMKVNEEMQQTVESLESDVERRREEIKQLADKHASCLLQSLYSERQGRLKEIQLATNDIDAYLSNLESYNSYCQRLMDKGSSHDICRAISDLAIRALELQQQCQPTVERGIMNFKYCFRQSALQDFLQDICGNLVGKIVEESDLKPITRRRQSLLTEESDEIDLQRMEVETEKTEKKSLRFVNEQLKELQINKTATEQLSNPEDNYDAHIARLKRELNKSNIANGDLQQELDAEKIKNNSLQTNYDKLLAELKMYKETVKASEINAEKVAKELKTSKAGEKRYRSDPVLVQTIRTKAAKNKNKAIIGMTILDNELFVLSDWVLQVEVYDTMKFTFSRQLSWKELSNPLDIGSCNGNKCLYIIDCKSFGGKSSEIWRVDPNGELITKWSTGHDFGFLSVTVELTIILTVYNGHKLNEYSPDGQLIRELDLSSTAGIFSPSHAIKLTKGHFVVSQYNRKLHRVCMVDEDGALNKSYGENCGSSIGQLNCPVHVCVDSKGFVMVADQLSGRVLMLDSNLEYERDILSKEKHGLRRPERILLDEINGRLFVADNESDNQRILIFDFK